MDVSLTYGDHVTGHGPFPQCLLMSSIGLKKLECKSNMICFSPHPFAPSWDIY